MSPLVSTDRCMNARLFKRTQHECTRPTFWTSDPDRRLCRKCHVALFGKEPS